MPEVVYFAYGSNLCLRRMRERVPSVHRIGTASLPGYALKWHKRSVDGSGKCSIAPADHDSPGVHGVLYSFPDQEKPHLDAVEGLGDGYDEVRVRVEGPSGPRLATTYIAASSHVDSALIPYSWYHALVIDGANRAGLPPEYVRGMERVKTKDDEETERAAAGRRTLPCEP